ncbi:hypothetical protein V1511DRAFT_508950 [Dipodascopsis uninucleata]
MVKFLTLRMGIRQQLIGLVLVCVLLSLVCLTTVLSVVMRNYILELRMDRLQIISLLKASQIQQFVQFYYEEVFGLSSKASVQKVVQNYNYKNGTQSDMSSLRTSLELYLNSGSAYVDLVIYSLDYTEIFNLTNNVIVPLFTNGIPTSLYPLEDSSEMSKILWKNGGLISGPVMTLDGILLSISIPILNNTISGTSLQRTSGYMTVIFNAADLANVVSDLSDSDSLNSTRISVFSCRKSNSTEPKYTYLLSSSDETQVSGNFYNIDTYPAVLAAFTHNSSGYLYDTYNEFETGLAVGYSIVDVVFDTWAITIEMKDSVVSQPLSHLRTLAIITSISISIFVCVVTFPIAHFAVRPIIKLTEATKHTSTGPDAGLNARSHSRSDHDGQPRSNSDDEDESPHVKSSSFRIPHVVPEKKHSLFSDELTELTRTFNEMTEELQKQYIYLEQRVADRTRQLEMAKEQAEEANTSKSVFIANITHELRTPLNGILGMTAVSLAEKDQYKIKKSLQIIYKSGELLLHLLTDLLIFSKTQLGQTAIEEKDFKINEIVAQIRAIFEKQASSVNVGLSVELVPQRLETMVLYGDANRILQVIINLVSNGLKFTQVNGNINVRIKCVGVVDEPLRKSSIPSTPASPVSPASPVNPVNPISQISNMFAGTDAADASKERSSVTSKPVEETEMDILSPVISINIEKTSLSNEFTEPRSLSNRKDSITEHLKMAKPKELVHSSRNNSLRANTSRKSSIDHKRSISEKQLPSFLNARGITGSTRRRDHALSISLGHNFSSNFENDSGSSVRLSSPTRMNKSSLSQDLDDFNNKYLILEFEVEDNGPGIPVHMQEKVFQPFVQGDQALSKKYGGAGLGLSICQQLVELMGGKIMLESTENVGSKFSFNLCLRYVKDTAPSLRSIGDEATSHREDSQTETVFVPVSSRGGTLQVLGAPYMAFTRAGEEELDDDRSILSDLSSLTDSMKYISETTTVLQESTDKSSNSSNGASPKHEENVSQSSSEITKSPRSQSECKSKLRQGVHIMVAEDNRINQQVIVRMLNLEEVGRVTIAKDGNEAIEKVKEVGSNGRHFDIIFMDIQMPNLDGLEATKMIRKDFHYTHPIVALTAYANDSNVVECMEAGMDSFLTKPINRDDLKKTIDRFCGPISYK